MGRSKRTLVVATSYRPLTTALQLSRLLNSIDSHNQPPDMLACTIATFASPSLAAVAVFRRLFRPAAFSSFKDKTFSGESSRPLMPSRSRRANADESVCGLKKKQRMFVHVNQMRARTDTK